MDFSWPTELESRKHALQEFVRDQLNPLLEQHSQGDGELFPAEAWAACAEHGLLGLSMPVALGGEARSILDVVYLLEALGYACNDNAFAYSVCAQIFSSQVLLQQFATPDQQNRWLAPQISGEICAFAISEAEAGSDALNLSTLATKHQGGYRLNGEKRYVTLAPVAERIVVFAKTEPDRGAWGVSAFVIDTDHPGLRVDSLSKTGLHSVPMGNVTLADCDIGDDALLGKLGSGIVQFSKAMDAERGFILISQIGFMARQLERAVAQAKQRRQGGRPIAKHQAVADRLVDMRVRLEASRLLTYHCAWLASNGKRNQMEAAMVNLFASESLLENSLDAYRNAAVRAYTDEDPSVHEVVDALGAVIYSGTSDIQRLLIAKQMGL